MNLPIITTKETIDYAVDVKDICEKELDYNNLWVDFHAERARHQENWGSEEEIKFNDSFTAFYINDLILMKRQYNFSGISFEKIDGATYMTSPSHPNKDPEIKTKSILIWDENTLCFTFSKNLINTMSRDLGQIKAEDKRRFDFAFWTIKQSLINILKKRTDKKIEVTGNDVLIDGKKILGGDVFLYKSGIREHGLINWKFDNDKYTQLLDKDENHKKSKEKRINNVVVNMSNPGSGAFSGLTGVSNEIPEYSREEFIQDFVEEVNKFIKMTE